MIIIIVLGVLVLILSDKYGFGLINYLEEKGLPQVALIIISIFLDLIILGVLIGVVVTTLFTI